MAGKTKLDPNGPRVCKNILPSPADVIAGYRTLHLQEARCTLQALEEMPDAVRVWYRYLTLHDRTLRREHESSSSEMDDAHIAWGLRLGLASGAASTAKLGLDAALAGYYSQAYALLRHLLETWLQLVFVRLNPQAARQWFSPDGVRPAQQPNPGTVVNGIKRLGKQDHRLLDNVALVEEELRQLHKGAHPSGLILRQAETGEPGVRQIGANFNRDLLGSVMSRGTVYLPLLLREITRSVPADEAWQAEFDAIGRERNRWHRAEFGDGPAG